MTTPRTHAQELWDAAREVIPGGVNSPVRAFGAVGGIPVFADRGKGSRLWDVDGKEYVDYVMSWGPMILGHAHPSVLAAVRETCLKGTSFGMPTAAENKLARRLVECVPSIEKVRLVNSGTEAAMSAIRLARGFTGRDIVIKCQGCYHGHVDGLLAAAGSGVATFAIPDTKGVPASYTEKTIIVPYNDLQAVATVFAARGREIAAIIIEPIAGNMGVVPPATGFLEGLRDLTQRHGALLVFDEVISGFRVALGGAQELFGVTPDLTVLGKIIGGGLPAAAYGGRRDIMDALAPDGGVYQAGTLSGNPLAVAAGLATVETLIATRPYAQLEATAAALAQGIKAAAADAGITIQQNRVGSMQTMFFTETPVTDYTSAKTSDTKRYADVFHGLLDGGVYLAPSQFEAGFVSTEHSDDDIARTVATMRNVFSSL